MRSDVDDFDWWYRSAYGRVARTVFLILHDRDRSEDIAQDAFFQLLRHWDRISGYEQPDAWVRRVAIRMAVRLVKRERGRVPRERLAQPATVVGEPHPEVMVAIRSLAPMQRAAVVLYYWDDQPVLEIARTLAVSESTVKQHLFRARSRLAELLGEEVTEDVR